MPEGPVASFGETWCGSVPAFLGRTGSKGAELLRGALAAVPGTDGWAVLLHYRLLRLGRRIDAVVVTPGAVLAFRIVMDATKFSAADRTAVEGAALDLADS